MKQDRKIKKFFAKQKKVKSIQISELKNFIHLFYDVFDLIILLDNNFNIVLSNGKLEVKIPADQNIFGIVHPDYHSIIQEKLNKINYSKTTETFDIQLNTSTKLVRVKCFCFKDESSVPFFLLLINDNSKVYQLKEKLANAEERFRTIVNTTNTWENWVNPYGDLIFVNPAIEKFTGYSFEESVWLFQHPEKYIYKDDFKRVVRNFNQSLTEETAGKDIFRIIKKDHTKIWISSTWSPVYNAEGKYLGIRSSLHDITEIKEKQQLLEENLAKLKIINSKLKEANTEIEISSKSSHIFVSNMSHLIRTPLNAILGMTEILYGKNLDMEEIELIEVIENSAENLLSVTTDIVDINKIESNSIVLEKRSFVLYDKLKAIINIIDAPTKRKNLDVEFQFPDKYKSLIIESDPARLNQILLNILNNAINYTSKGFIKLNIKIKETVNNTFKINFEISDSGIGISENDLSQIFNSFLHTGSHDTKKIKGLGLGLFICKRIVELMNGSIIVESKEGKGSTFIVQIEFNKGIEPDSGERKNYGKQLAEKRAKIQNINILLVEDQEFNQILIRKITDAWNCKLDIAFDGYEAIDLLKKNSYDLVLMDIQLPNMSGLQATKIIRSELEEPNKSIPIIALTANAIEGDNESYIRAGMNDYLAKPFRSQELFDKIIRNLGKKTNYKKVMGKNTNLNENGGRQYFSLDKILEIAKGEKSFVREMILVFIDQCDEIKELLAIALQEKNVEKLGENAHKLKSSANIMQLYTIENEVIEMVDISRKDIENPKIFDLSQYVINQLDIVIPLLKKELLNWPA